MMNRNVLVLAVSAFLMMSAAEAAPAVQSKHAERGVACTVCHGEKLDVRPTASTCLTCHGPAEALAKKTEHLNFMSKMKNAKTGEVKEHKALVNPHDSYHFGTTLQCSECHSEHKASRNDCSTCHDTDAWKIRRLN